MNCNLTQLKKKLLKTFDSDESAKLWLQTHNFALQAKPNVFLNTPEHIAEIRKILSAIRYGGVVWL